MPKKRKATVAHLATLAAARDTLSVKRQKSIGGDSDLSDGNEEMTSDIGGRAKSVYRTYPLLQVRKTSRQTPFVPLEAFPCK